MKKEKKEKIGIGARTIITRHRTSHRFMLLSLSYLEGEDSSNTGSNSTKADGVTASSTGELRRSGGEGRGPGGSRGGVGEAGLGDDGRLRSAAASGLHALGAGRGGDSCGLGDGGFSIVRGSGRSGGSAGRLVLAVVGVLDTELGGPLVGTLVGTRLNDDKKTVVGDIGLELGAGGPLEGTLVGDVLGESVQGLDVLARTTEEN